MNHITSQEQTSKPSFPLGQILATPGAISALQESEQKPLEFLSRHLKCDWGDVCEEDKALNDEAIIEGSRILSAYHTSKGEKLWIITEAADDQGQREATTILLPDEY
jgi:hypothetical protein